MNEQKELEQRSRGASPLQQQQRLETEENYKSNIKPNASLETTGLLRNHIRSPLVNKNISGRQTQKSATRDGGVSRSIQNVSGFYFQNESRADQAGGRTPTRNRSLSPSGALLIESFKQTYGEDAAKREEADLARQRGRRDSRASNKSLNRSLSQSQIDKISGIILVQKAQNSISGILKKHIQTIEKATSESGDPNVSRMSRSSSVHKLTHFQSSKRQPKDKSRDSRSREKSPLAKQGLDLSDLASKPVPATQPTYEFDKSGNEHTFYFKEFTHEHTPQRVGGRSEYPELAADLKNLKTQVAGLDVKYKPFGEMQQKSADIEATPPQQSHSPRFQQIDVMATSNPFQLAEETKLEPQILKKHQKVHMSLEKLPIAALGKSSQAAPQTARPQEADRNKSIDNFIEKCQQSILRKERSRSPLLKQQQSASGTQLKIRLPPKGTQSIEHLKSKRNTLKKAMHSGKKIKVLKVRSPNASFQSEASEADVDLSSSQQQSFTMGPRRSSQKHLPPSGGRSKVSYSSRNHGSDAPNAGSVVVQKQQEFMDISELDNEYQTHRPSPSAFKSGVTISVANCLSGKQTPHCHQQCQTSVTSSPRAERLDLETQIEAAAALKAQAAEQEASRLDTELKSLVETNSRLIGEIQRLNYELEERDTTSRISKISRAEEAGRLAKLGFILRFGDRCQKTKTASAFLNWKLQVERLSAEERAEQEMEALKEHYQEAANQELHELKAEAEAKQQAALNSALEKQRQDILSGMVSHQNQLQRMNRREMLLTRVFERCKLVHRCKTQAGLLLWKAAIDKGNHLELESNVAAETQELALNQESRIEEARVAAAEEARLVTEAELAQEKEKMKDEFEAAFKKEIELVQIQLKQQSEAEAEIKLQEQNIELLRQEQQIKEECRLQIDSVLEEMTAKNEEVEERAEDAEAEALLVKKTVGVRMLVTILSRIQERRLFSSFSKLERVTQLDAAKDEVEHQSAIQNKEQELNLRQNLAKAELAERQALAKAECLEIEKADLEEQLQAASTSGYSAVQVNQAQAIVILAQKYAQAQKEMDAHAQARGFISFCKNSKRQVVLQQIFEIKKLQRRIETLESENSELSTAVKQAQESQQEDQIQREIELAEKFQLDLAAELESSKIDFSEQAETYKSEIEALRFELEEKSAEIQSKEMVSLEKQRQANEASEQAMLLENEIDNLKTQLSEARAVTAEVQSQEHQKLQEVQNKLEEERMRLEEALSAEKQAQAQLEALALKEEKEGSLRQAELETQMQIKQAEIDRLLVQNDELLMKIKQLSQDVSASGSEAAQLKSDLQMKQWELDKLQSEVTASKQLIVTANSQNSEAAAQLQQATAKIQILEQLQANSESQKGAMLQQIQSEAKKNAEKEQFFKEKIASMEKQVKEFIAQDHSQQEIKMAAIKQQHEQQVARLTQRVDQAEALLAKSKEQNQSVMQDVIRITEEEVSRKKMISDLQEKVRRMEAEKTDMTDKYQQDLQSANSIVRQQKHDHLELVEKLDLELQQSLKERESLEANLKQVLAQLDQLKIAQLESQESTLQQTEEYKSKFGEIHGQIQKKNIIIEQLQTALEEESSSAERVKSDLEVARKKYQEAKAEAQAAYTGLENYQVILEKFERNLSVALKDKEAAQIERDQALQEIRIVRQRYISIVGIDQFTKDFSNLSS